MAKLLGMVQAEQHNQSTGISDMDLLLETNRAACQGR